MNEIIAASVGGLLSSVHCIGMCGGFAAAIGAAGEPIGPTVARQLVYSAGRIFTYAFLGALGGFAGVYLSRFDTALVTVQQVFSVLAGVMMLLVGASVLGLLRFRRVSSSGVDGSSRTGSVLTDLFAPMFKHFLNARGWSGFFIAGLANGYLPCGLVYAFLAQAVATGHVVKGMALMAAFGVGTTPAMVAIGCGSTLLGHTMRARVFKLAACFVILVGVVTIARAFPSQAATHCH